MLEELRIQGLGVIADAVLPLARGLTVVTGETGAGKTMVVQGLSLLFGGRGDAGRVRPGAARGVVEGRLVLPAEHPVVLRALEAGAELDDDVLLVARSVGADGRSRAHLGGRAVPVGVLGELAEQLVAVHGQSDQQRLLQPTRQRAALDRFAGEPVTSLAAQFAAGWERWRGVRASLEQLTAEVAARYREAEVLRAGLAEVEAADPQPGEDGVLRAEIRRLDAADELRAASATAAEALTGGEDAGPDVGPNALALLAAARGALDAAGDADPALAALAARVTEATYLVVDVASDVAAYASGVDVDPARLAAAQERLALLTTLERRYLPDPLPRPAGAGPPPERVPAEGVPAEGVPAEGVPAEGPPGAGPSAQGPPAGADAVLAWSAAASDRLLELDGTGDRLAGLTEQESALRAELGALGGRLSRERQAAAERFGAAVTAELGALAMPQAVVSAAVTQREDPVGLAVGERVLAAGTHGVDDVELLLTPHPGAPARALHRGASGGELSRVMLAVEVVFAGSDPVPVMVFDEVDAGVGGRAAVEVGRRLARLAQTHQVLVVTHLPQVAAFADAHLQVVKSSDGSVTSSGVVLLDEPARVAELSRMLAGHDSGLARGHAEELLASSRDLVTADRDSGPADPSASAVPPAGAASVAGPVREKARSSRRAAGGRRGP